VRLGLLFGWPVDDQQVAPDELRDNGPARPAPPPVDIVGSHRLVIRHDRQGVIAFDSVEQPGVRAIGEIQEDGSFTLTTVKDGVSTPGAIAGTHRVRLDLDDSATRFVAPQFLDFQKSGITVKVPSDQPLEIKVWR